MAEKTARRTKTDRAEVDGIEKKEWLSSQVLSMRLAVLM